jgi:hypothetical protein
MSAEGMTVPLQWRRRSRHRCPGIATSNPWPSTPILFSTGTSTFSKKSSPVEPAQIPSLCSVSRKGEPRHSLLQRERREALWPAAGSVLANTRVWSATVACAIQFFCPFRT